MGGLAGNLPYVICALSLVSLLLVGCTRPANDPAGEPKLVEGSRIELGPARASAPILWPREITLLYTGDSRGATASVPVRSCG